MKEDLLEKIVLERDLKTFIDLFSKDTDWNYKTSQNTSVENYKFFGKHKVYEDISYELEYFKHPKGTSYFFKIKEEGLTNNNILIKQTQNSFTNNIIQVGEGNVKDFLMESLIQKLSGEYKKYLA